MLTCIDLATRGAAEAWFHATMSQPAEPSPTFHFPPAEKTRSKHISLSKLIMMLQEIAGGTMDALDFDLLFLLVLC